MGNTSGLTFEEFRREIAGGKIRPAYFFQGEEDFLAREGADLVVRMVLPGPERSFCLSEPGPETTAADLKRMLLTPSFFGSKTVVRLHDPGRLAAEAQDALAAAAGSLPPGIHLVMTGQIDKRRAASKSLLAGVSVIDCAPMKKREAVAWAQDRARSLGMTLAPDAAQYLVDIVGPHLRMIAGELEKGQTYLGGERSQLARRDLELLLGYGLEEDVFRLIEAAVPGRTEEALRMLANLLALGQPEPVILAVLSKQTRQILLAGHLRSQGKGAAEIAAALGVQPFVAEKLAAQSLRMPPRRCRALLQRMLLADVRSKTGERDPRLELEMVVLAMAGGDAALAKRHEAR